MGVSVSLMVDRMFTPNNLVLASRDLEEAANVCTRTPGFD